MKIFCFANHPEAVKQRSSVETTRLVLEAFGTLSLQDQEDVLTKELDKLSSHDKGSVEAKHLVLEAFSKLSIQDQEDILHKEFHKLSPHDQEEVLEDLKTCRNMETKTARRNAAKLAVAKKRAKDCLAKVIEEDDTRADPQLILDAMVKLSSDKKDDLMDVLELMLDKLLYTMGKHIFVVGKACIDVLVSLMAKYIHVPEIQNKGIHLLEVVKYALAFEPVCAAMKEHPDNCHVQRAGLSALLHTVHAEHAGRFVKELKGTALIVAAMRKFHNDIEIQQSGEALLEKLICI
jgi:putative NADH-flavin reductase